MTDRAAKPDAGRRRWRGLAGLALRLAVRSRQVASLIVLLVVA